MKITLKILVFLIALTFGFSIIYSFETNYNDGLLYHLELSNPSTYNISCYNQLSSKWKVSNNTCWLETSKIKIPFSEDTILVDVPVKINIYSSGNLNDSDYVYFQAYIKNKWISIDSILGTNIAKTPSSHTYYVKNIQTGDKIKFKLTFHTNSEKKHITLFNKNKEDFSVGTPYISGTNIHYTKNFSPIDLVSFTAKVMNGRIFIEWITGYEYDNKNFTLEKSINGIDFETINKIDGLKYSNRKQLYGVYDELPESKHIYYRLKQTDFYNRTRYYDIFYINNDKDLSEICIDNVYPDPCLGKCNLDLSSCPDSVLMLNFYTLDALGNITTNKISKSLLDSSTFTSFDVENNFKPGIYILRINDKDTATSDL